MRRPKGLVEKHLVPFFESAKIASIRPTKVNAYVESRTGEAVAGTIIKHLESFVRRCLGIGGNDSHEPGAVDENAGSPRRTNAATRRRFLASDSEVSRGTFDFRGTRSADNDVCQAGTADQDLETILKAKGILQGDDATAFAAAAWAGDSATNTVADTVAEKYRALCSALGITVDASVVPISDAPDFEKRRTT
jgi:hypothetical protein